MMNTAATIYTTTAWVIGSADDLHFSRVFDEHTGYDELHIAPHPDA